MRSIAFFVSLVLSLLAGAGAVQAQPNTHQAPEPGEIPLRAPPEGQNGTQTCQVAGITDTGIDCIAERAAPRIAAILRQGTPSVAALVAAPTPAPAPAPTPSTSRPRRPRRLPSHCRSGVPAEGCCPSGQTFRPAEAGRQARCVSTGVMIAEMRENIRRRREETVAVSRRLATFAQSAPNVIAQNAMCQLRASNPSLVLPAGVNCQNVPTEIRRLEMAASEQP